MANEEKTDWRRFLNTEDRKTLQKEFKKVSRETIRRWLLPNNTSASEDFLIRAIELANARKKKRETIAKKIKSVIA